MLGPAELAKVQVAVSFARSAILQNRLVCHVQLEPAATHRLCHIPSGVVQRHFRNQVLLVHDCTNFLMASFACDLWLYFCPSPMGCCPQLGADIPTNERLEPAHCQVTRVLLQAGVSQDEEGQAAVSVLQQDSRSHKKRLCPEEKATNEAKRQRHAGRRSSQQSKAPESVPEAKGESKKKHRSNTAGSTAEHTQDVATGASAQSDTAALHAAKLALSEAGPDPNPLSGDLFAPAQHLSGNMSVCNMHKHMLLLARRCAP